jgi:hypothetical protein
MDYKAFYIALKTRREQSIVLRDALLDLQRQWVQWNPLPLTAEDPLGDDLYTAYNLIHQAIQKIPTFDWAQDTGGLKPVDGAQSFEKYAVSIKGEPTPAPEPPKPVTSFSIGFIDGEDRHGHSCFIHKQGCRDFYTRGFVDHYTVTGTLDEAIESYLDAELREQGFDESIVKVFPCAEGRID